MPREVYELLAKALDRLPNGFPRTPSRVELLLLERIFSPEEASLAAHLGGSMEPAGEISRRAGLPVDVVAERLKALARRGLLWVDKGPSELHFRLAPFVVGIYEAQLQNMDHDLARLVEEYLADGGAAGIMQPDPAIHRVVPARDTVPGEWILPYDDVRAILLTATSFSVRNCICRVQRGYLRHPCEYPLRICLLFNTRPGVPGQDDISREEAIALLDKAEEVGLVHCVSNITKGIGYICNCCGCCCAILRGITEWGIEKSVAHANYYAVIDPDRCQGCGTCIGRCQVAAISDDAGISVVDRDRCIGCGLCVSGCSDDAASLLRKSDSEIVTPPEDFPAWEHERLRNRGLKP